MSFSNDKLGMMIRNGRKDMNLTQEQLSEKLDCNLSYFGNIERGNNTPSLPLFCEIFRTLNLSADAFIYPDKHNSDNTYQQLNRILNQCTARELNIILAVAMTLMKNRSEKPSE